jgi:hypothetical protein
LFKSVIFWSRKTNKEFSPIYTFLKVRIEKLKNLSYRRIMKNYVFLLLFGCCLTKYRFFIRLVVRQIKRQTDRQTFIYARLICGRDIYMFNKRKDFKGGWWIRWWHVGGGGFTSICEWKAAAAASRVKRRENESFCLDRMLKNNHTF